jgi:hypothetical protein
MSDTSIVSTTFSYDDEKRYSRNDHDHSSFCNRYWFHITFILLLIIILITSTILIYILYKQAQRDRERQRIQNEFKQKHGVANKVLDLITKDGIISKWFKKNQSSLVTIFKQLMTEMVETIFNQ